MKHRAFLYFLLPCGCVWIFLFNGCVPPLYLRSVPKSVNCGVVKVNLAIGSRLSAGYIISKEPAKCFLFDRKGRLLRAIETQNGMKYCLNPLQVQYYKCMRNGRYYKWTRAGAICPFSGNVPSCPGIMKTHNGKPIITVHPVVKKPACTKPAKFPKVRK